MDLEKAIEIGSDIDMLPWFTLPIGGIKIDIGNGFIAWHDHETKSGDIALFIIEKKGKRNLTILTATTNCPKHPHWHLVRSALKTDRLEELVQLLFKVAARVNASKEVDEVQEREDLEDEDEVPKTTSSSSFIPHLEPPK